MIGVFIYIIKNKALWNIEYKNLIQKRVSIEKEVKNKKYNLFLNDT